MVDEKFQRLMYELQMAWDICWHKKLLWEAAQLLFKSKEEKEQIKERCIENLLNRDNYVGRIGADKGVDVLKGFFDIKEEVIGGKNCITWRS